MSNFLPEGMPKGTTASIVQMTPKEIQKKAKREGAKVYENNFENSFEPWPREKINKCMTKIKNGEEEDEELKEFKRLHPVISKMAESANGDDALAQLFAAHDDIVSRKASKEEVMKKMMFGIFENMKKG